MLFPEASPLRGPSVASAPSAPIQLVMHSLKIQSIADLALLSKASIDSECVALKLSASDKAEIEIAIAKFSSHRDGTSALANAVELQRLQRIWPWKTDEERALRQLTRFQEDYAAGDVDAMKALRAEFISRAKSGLLGNLETLVGQYCLFSSDSKYGAYLLMCLLLRLPPDSRINTHNWAIAQELPRATREAYGSRIAALTLPMFPHDPALEAVNTKILQGSSKTAGQNLDLVDGAGWLPVLQHQESGAYGVETLPLDTAIKAEFDNLRGQIQRLQQQQGQPNQFQNGDNNGRRGRGNRHQQPQQPQYQQQPQQQQQPYQQQQRPPPPYQQQQQSKWRRPTGGASSQPAQPSPVLELDDIFAPPQATAPPPSAPASAVKPRF